jgi:fatty acid CoA ligase FadD9
MSTGHQNTLVASIPQLSYGCDRCGKPCDLARHHCMECSDYDLCPSCFVDAGRRCDEGHDFFASETCSFTEVRSTAIRRAGHGIGSMLQASMRRWPDRPCVGVKDDRTLDGGPLPTTDGRGYRYMRYRELHKRAMVLLRGLHDALFANSGEGEADAGFDVEEARAQYHLEPADAEPMRAAILFPNSADWVVADVALALGGFNSVPLDNNASRETLLHILTLSNARFVVTSRGLLARHFSTLVRADCPDLKFIVTMDDDDDDGGGGVDSTTNVPWRVWPHTELVRGHRDIPVATSEADMQRMEDSLLVPSREPQQCFTLLFTSGSTGRPKGAITTHGGWSYCSFEVVLMRSPLVSLLYRPLCYATDRENLWRCLANGGRVALFTGDEHGTLFDCVSLARPTAFSAPPRVWNLLYDRFQADLKAQLREAAASSSSSASPEDVKAKLTTTYGRTMLGDRCQLVGVGGARPRPEVFQFLKDVFGPRSRVYESYGTTENGGIAVNGAIPASARVKLVDVPEMGFLTTNNPPQGEICVITPDGIPGYWRDEANTAALFYVDDKGEKWHRTGDIGQSSANGKLEVIDRRSNLVKLSTSVFISPEFLESVFLNAPSVADVFVYAESAWDFPLCVVTTEAGALTQAAVLREFRALAEQQGVPASHLPHGVLIHPERFTVENKCLTISLKLSRPGLRQRFQQALRDLYAQITKTTSSPSQRPQQQQPQQQPGVDPLGGDEDDEEDHPMMQRESSSILFFSPAAIDDDDAEGVDVGAVTAKLQALFCKVLQYSSVDATDSCKALQAGSLAVVTLKERIQRLTGATVSIDTLWATPIEDLARIILHQSPTTAASTDVGAAAANAKKQQQQRAAAASQIPKAVLGLAAQLRADSVYATAAAAEDHLQKVATKKKVPRRRRTVLLTGATGFIGSHVLSSLVFGSATVDVGINDDVRRVVCLVRGGAERLLDAPAFESSADLRPRLRRSLAGVVLAATEQQQQEEEEEEAVLVDVLEGDLAAPLLGLSAETAAALRRDVTDVLHCGAMVNHVMPYDVLAQPNVGSVRALLEIFGTDRNDDDDDDESEDEAPSKLERFSFVSTISVVSLTESGTQARETPPLPTLSPALLHQLEPSGYALSKWAAESLLIDAARRGRLPRRCRLVIHRCGMTAWSTRSGVGNRTDWLSAFFKACSLLGAAPAAAASCQETAPRWLNLVPVDWVADVVASTRGSTVTAAKSLRGSSPSIGITHLVAARPTNVTPVAVAAAGGPDAAKLVTEAAWRGLLAKAVGDDLEGALGDLTPAAVSMLRAAAMFFADSVPGGNAGILTTSTSTHLSVASLAPDCDVRLAPRKKEPRTAATSTDLAGAAARYIAWIDAL